jgi:hypothetical protein
VEILGIGPSELFFILIIALVVLGPKDLQKAGRSMGGFLRRLTASEGWLLLQQTSREIQTLPNRLMREAAMHELEEVELDLRPPLKTGPTPGGPHEAAAIPQPDETNSNA